jgi:hypothetical protein
MGDDPAATHVLLQLVAGLGGQVMRNVELAQGGNVVVADSDHGTLSQIAADPSLVSGSGQIGCVDTGLSGWVRKSRRMSV